MRKFFSVLSVVAGLIAACLWIAAPASAAPSSPPFSDPSAAGYVGFCDAHDHQIRSGSINTYPFLVKAVSSTAAPKGYGYPHGRATLYVYQPLQYVNPGDWSGKQMSGASVFSNDKHPMVAGVKADPSLVNFAAAFPLHWNGYAQFRVYYTAPNSQQYNLTYPTATVQVKGTTWRQVGGGSVDCKAGLVRSNEVDLKQANRAAVPVGGRATAPRRGEVARHASTGASGGPPAGAGASDAAGSSVEGRPAASTSHSGRSAGSTFGVIGAVIVAVLLGVAVRVFVRRRRGTA